ncbi:MAG: tetratricopeptide repeat protein [Bdellovibrionales bacterium]|nr:tetratricopeptide repeat protein [Bdellovibrionales bacterium]
MKGGEKTEALNLYRRLALKYKGEFAFNYYYASALNEEGDLTNASTFAKHAVDNSYGDNWLRAVTLLAKIQIKQGKKSEAEKTVNAALAKAVMPESTQIRSHRYLAALRNVLKDTK